jgi:Leucine rich repeat
LISIILFLTTFHSQCEGLAFGCTYSVQTVWRMGGLYTCEASVFLFGDARVVTQVSGNHQAGRTNRHVTGLNIRNQNIGFVPREIGRFFPNLESLFVFNVGLVDVSPLELEGLPQLRQLDLSANPIQVIQANLLWYNPRIQHISFVGDPIQHIAVGVFDFRYDLNMLLFDLAACTSSFASNRGDVVNLITRLNIECPPAGQSVASQEISQPSSSITEEAKLT